MHSYRCHLTDGAQLAMHDVFPLRGLIYLKLKYTAHVPPHYTCPSTLHMSLHTTHVPPHYTCPSTLHMSLPTIHVPPHYTCPSTLHMSLDTTHVPPHYTCPSTHYTCPSTQSQLRTIPRPHEKTLSCTDVCWEYTHPNLSTLCSPISAPHPS